MINIFIVFSPGGGQNRHDYSAKVEEDFIIIAIVIIALKIANTILN